MAFNFDDTYDALRTRALKAERERDELWVELENLHEQIKELGGMYADMEEERDDALANLARKKQTEQIAWEICRKHEAKLEEINSLINGEEEC